MANRNFSRLQALNHEVKVIAGNFSVAAGVATKVQGLGWSVANSGTGEFTVTLEDGYIALLAANAMIEDAGGVNLAVQVDSHDVVAAKTVVFNTVVGATPTATDCTVHFTLFLRNSEVA